MAEYENLADLNISKSDFALIMLQHLCISAVLSNSPFSECTGVFADALTFLACSCRYLIWSAMTVSLLQALALMKSSP